jgi:carbonic anhydrase
MDFMFLGGNTFEWDYTANGPDAWPQYFPTCKGALQSPINLQTSSALYDILLKDINFINYDKVLSWNMTNNGHSSN